jgi:hypothetical protein
LLRVKVSTEQELNKNIILHNSQFCRLTWSELLELINIYPSELWGKANCFP